MENNWSGYKNYDHYWLVHQRAKWLNEIVDSQPATIEVGKERYYNIPACFDIETSSYYSGGKKRATMYCWSLCINGSTLFGRTWDEFVDIINYIAEHFHTDYRRLVIYVHNLGYEFQFMRNWFDFEDVFAVKERRPVHCNLKNGIEFKCSYLLSNYSLAYIGEKLLKKYGVKKDVGNLNYSLVRHSKTAMTNKEIWYSIHDVQVINSFIQEKLENGENIATIPLTNTGYVRQYCREYCFTQFEEDAKTRKKMSAKYHEKMRGLQITSKCEYDQLQEAFGGGFVHAGPEHSGEVLYDVSSDDEASAYPGTMVTDKFPMGRSTFIGECDQSDIDWLTSDDSYCIVFTIRMHNVYPKFRYENYISVSHCQELSKDAVTNNGRVASASVLQTTVTECDWDIIKRCYEWDEIEFFNLRIYPADYLPRPFIMSILHLFANKTSLKGVEGRETEYMVSKNMINAAYGMSVTSIIRDIYEYSNVEGWSTSDANVEEQLSKYNTNYNRFLFYAWGVWVTAHARHNLWEAIFEFGEDYVYADTDSIKGLNRENHELFFRLYNLNMEMKLKKMCHYWQIPFEFCQPKTKDGKIKTIGVWEREDDYKVFKTIGAKRYMYEYMNGELSFTIAGVNKNTAVPFLLIEYTGYEHKEDEEFCKLAKLAYNNAPDKADEAKAAKKKIIEMHNNGELSYSLIFKKFNEGLYFPAEFTGKQTLTYIDEPFIGECRDYTGQPAIVYEKSYIHMEPQGYSLSLTEEYLRFLAGYRDASL